VSITPKNWKSGDLLDYKIKSRLSARSVVRGSFKHPAGDNQGYFGYSIIDIEGGFTTSAKSFIGALCM